MKINKLAYSSLITLTGYSLLVALFSVIFKFDLGFEFFLAIFFIIFYFLLAFAFLWLSLNQKKGLFYKVFFLGSIIRIAMSLVLFLIIIKLTDLDVLKILLYIVPIYFLFLLLETLWVKNNVATMEKDEHDIS